MDYYAVACSRLFSVLRFITYQSFLMWLEFWGAYGEAIFVECFTHFFRDLGVFTSFVVRFLHELNFVQVGSFLGGKGVEFHAEENSFHLMLLLKHLFQLYVFQNILIQRCYDIIMTFRINVMFDFLSNIYG